MLFEVWQFQTKVGSFCMLPESQVLTTCLVATMLWGSLCAPNAGQETFLLHFSRDDK